MLTSLAATARNLRKGMSEDNAPLISENDERDDSLNP